MVLVNKKMLAGGMAMVIVGLVLTININAVDTFWEGQKIESNLDQGKKRERKQNMKSCLYGSISGAIRVWLFS